MNEILLVTLQNGDTIEVGARFASSSEEARPFTNRIALELVSSLISVSVRVKETRFCVVE